MPRFLVKSTKMLILANFPKILISVYTLSKLLNVKEATRRPYNYPKAKVNVIRPMYRPLKFTGVISDNIVTPHGAKKPTITLI